MGRRSRNQGNIKNYFQNLGEHFFGTTKANEASDAITRDYQKKIDERTKKRNEERTQELSDFDTARSKEVEGIKRQYQAGYDAAESTRQTALQNANKDFGSNCNKITNSGYTLKHWTIHKKRTD